MKFTKVLGMLAATSLIFGSLFTSCGGGDDDDDSPSKVMVESIAVTAADNAVSVKVEGTLQLSAAVTPDNATEKGVTWSSSDDTKATVSENGLVTGVAVADEVTITATAKDGSNKAGSITLKVLAKDAAPQKYTCTGCGTEYDTQAERDDCAKQSGCPKYVDPSKGSQEAPAAGKFTATAPTSKDGTDGKISVTAELANLKYKGADGVEHDATAEITGLAAGTYAFYYAATDTLNASANTDVVVEAFVAYFTSFDVNAIDLGEANEKSYSDTNYGAGKELTADDGSWKVYFSGSSASYKIQVKDSNGNSVGANTYDYDATAGTGYSYTKRLSTGNTNDKVQLWLKVKAGEEVVLRIDGASGSGSASRGIIVNGDTSKKAATDCTFTNTNFGTNFVTATANANGWVTLGAGVGSFNIYGVHVVSADSVVDTKTIEVTPIKKATFEKPVVTLGAESVSAGTAITATVSIPKYKVTTTKLYADGNKSTETPAEEEFDVETPVVEWTVDGNVVEAQADGSLSYETASDADDANVVVKASYTGKYTINDVQNDIAKQESEAKTVKVEASGARYDVKFYDGETELTDLATTAVEGKKVIKPADPTKTKSKFVGWYKESALTTEWKFDTDTVTAATSLYAKWEELNGTPYTEYFDFYATSATPESWTAASSTEVTFGTGDKNKTSATYYFKSGIYIVSGTGGSTKIGAKEAVYDDYKTKARIALDKSSNGASIVIPVEGDCTIYVGHGNNKGDGTVRALKATASATGATVTALNGDNPNTAVYNDATQKGVNTVGQFKYVGGAGTVTLTGTLADGTTAAGGTCYVGVIEVKY